MLSHQFQTQRKITYRQYRHLREEKDSGCSELERITLRDGREVFHLPHGCQDEVISHFILIGLTSILEVG